MAWTFWEYPTSYNSTNVSSASDFFLDYPAFISSGVSAITMMIFVFLTLFAMGLPFGVGAALTAASFISFILSTYLWWNGVLGIIYPLTFFSLTIASAIIVGNSKN